MGIPLGTYGEHNRNNPQKIPYSHPSLVPREKNDPS